MKIRLVRNGKVINQAFLIDFSNGRKNVKISCLTI